MMISHEELNRIYPIITLLENLGLKKIEEREKYYKFSSPFREDKNPSMVLYKNNLMCIDFSSRYKNNLFSFVKDITGETLYSVTGIDRKKLYGKMFENSLQTRKEFPNRIKSIKINGMLNKVEKSEEALSYCQRRNLFVDFRKKFDIRYMKSGKINDTYFGNRICIPIVSDGKTVSMEGRDVTGKARAKVLYPKGAYVSTLFNIDNLKRKEPLIVVEGIMDIPKIWKFFTKNVTTTFGIMITSRQKELLNTFDEIILMPDGDKAGEDMIDEFDSFYEGEYKIARLKGKDPGDAFVKEIEASIKDAKTSTQYFLERSGLFEEENKKEAVSIYDV